MQIYAVPKPIAFGAFLQEPLLYNHSPNRRITAYSAHFEMSLPPRDAKIRKGNKVVARGASRSCVIIIVVSSKRSRLYRQIYSSLQMNDLNQGRVWSKCFGRKLEPVKAAALLTPIFRVSLA